MSGRCGGSAAGAADACPAPQRSGAGSRAMASKLLRAVVLGPPGSGKGTVCERIARSFGLQHLSSGQFLRESLGGGGGECPGGTGSGGVPAPAAVGMRMEVAVGWRRGWPGSVSAAGAPQVVFLPWVWHSSFIVCSLQPELREPLGKSGI